MTVEQFEQLPLDDGFRYELKGGELVKMANAKPIKMWAVARVESNPLRVRPSDTTIKAIPTEVSNASSA